MAKVRHETLRIDSRLPGEVVNVPDEALEKLLARIPGLEVVEGPEAAGDGGGEDADDDLGTSAHDETREHTEDVEAQEEVIQSIDELAIEPALKPALDPPRHLGGGTWEWDGLRYRGKKNVPTEAWAKE